MNLSLSEVAHWTGGELRLRHPGAVSETVTGYSIDTRTIVAGELFFAIRGERYDAHDFLPAAFDRGALAAVISRAKATRFAELARAQNMILVEEPLTALQTLAAAVRRQWGGRVIAVTGSAGKTTTKEAIAAVLSSRFKALKSKGNLNNAFGLPLQLLRLNRADEVAVIEMGMSGPGEIAALARIATPDWGVVTNVGNAHAGNFADGIAGVARAKYELIQALPSSGAAFLNCDDPYVSQFGREYRGRAVYFGRGPCADPRAEEIEDCPEGSSFWVAAGGKRVLASLSLLGRHNVQNALAAIAVGLEAGMALEACIAAAEALRPPGKRGEILRARGAIIINDCYNSNPEALRSMMEALKAMPAKRRILIAGEMMELGAESIRLHRECGAYAGRSGIDLVVGVRGNARHIVNAARENGAMALFLESPVEAGEWLAAEARDGDAVLLKASRGVGLERALGWIEAQN